MDGILGSEYHQQRLRKRSHRYRLWRRGIEVARAIQAYCPAARTLLDIGTADGLAIPIILQAIPRLQVIGLEMAWDLLQAGNRSFFSPVQGNATGLPFPDAIFDVTSATAVIEHLHRPDAMIHECYRVLKPGGICIVTTPDPFFERIATAIGHLDDDKHNIVFNMTRLRDLFNGAGFRVVEATRFMMSPIGFPFEMRFEKIIKMAKIGFLLLNQIVVGQKGER